MVLAARFSVGKGASSGEGAAPGGAARALGPAGPRLGFAPTPGSNTWARDKKNEDGRVTLILLDDLGRASVVKDAQAAELRAFLAAA
jgi:hypothetical protein